MNSSTRMSDETIASAAKLPPIASAAAIARCRPIARTGT